MANVGMAWTTGVVAFVAAVPLWRFTTHAITIAHEGGHAMFGSLVGLFVKKVTIDRGGGGTSFTKEPKDLSLLQILAVGLTGYLGPSIFGFAGAWMLVHDISPRSVLLMTLVLMAMLLVMVRSLFGFLAVPLTGALIWVVAMRSTEQVQLVFAYIWIWFLLMGGTRQIPELFSVWKQGGEPDTGNLAVRTGLSTAFFVALFWLLSVAALVYGGVLLLRHTP
ncbi:M50 family metallopeptidase [Actinoplanes sp. TBRC 11911]|uniref:M50 family metallopeptidase n=1 Tax=Actinoplanes sp. TBRC 11911 TaxID=2729386 RepID=UPI00145E256F|nr:M50 family metallopeptidase [Actinoplanes sp. TBRC 11911]NMO50378.1 M50 family metallopeptidase [Actinoplanes sp. TBRC 11911]